MRSRVLFLLTLWIFFCHALDADCLLRDCHCTPSTSCSVPLTVQPSQTAIVPERVVPVLVQPVSVAVQYPERPGVQPPQPAPPLLTPPRAPPA